MGNPMLVSSEIIMPNVYLFTYDKQYDLCMSFVRLQEFYESPKFRNKYFTLEDFMDYWSVEYGNGSFDYPVRWNGFNLPSNIIDKWYRKFVDNEDFFRDRECELLDEVQMLKWEESTDEECPEKYYAIGIHEGCSEESSQEVIDHECAHALYYLYPSYRRSCNKLIKGMSKGKVDRATNELLSMGYCKDVLKDEIQAYFSSKHQRTIHKCLSGVKKFTDNFEKHKKKWIMSHEQG